MIRHRTFWLVIALAVAAVLIAPATLFAQTYTQWTTGYHGAGGSVIYGHCGNPVLFNGTVDCDADGIREYIFVDRGGYVRVHEWNGTANTLGPLTWTSLDIGWGGWQGVCVADLDRDGRREIIAADSLSHIEIFELSSGGLSSTNPSTTPTAWLAPPDDPESVWVDDVDGDGLWELYVAYGDIALPGASSSTNFQPKERSPLRSSFRWKPCVPFWE